MVGFIIRDYRDTIFSLLLLNDPKAPMSHCGVFEQMQTVEDICERKVDMNIISLAEK